MKKNKMRVTVYGLLPVTLGLSAANVALAEENLETITVSTELDNSTKANHSEKKTAAVI